MKYFWLLLAFLLGACSSSPKEDYNIDNIVLQLSETDSKINLSELVDSIVYIPLETNEQSLLGDIDRIIVTENGDYLIADKETASGVFVFDSKGHFLQKIGKRGSSPSEYVKLEDMSYYNQSVYIWDSGSRKILEYSLYGEWKNSYNFNYMAYSFSCVGDNEFVFYCDYVPNKELLKDNGYPNFIRYNTETMSVESNLFFNKDIPSNAYLLSLNNLSNNNIYSTMNDTIYKVDGDSLKRKYVLNYKERYKSNRESYINDILSSSYNENFRNKYLFPQLITYFECKNMDLFFLRFGKYLCYLFYYPETDLCREASSTTCPIVNNIDGTAPFFIRYSKDNVLYSVVEPELIIEKNSALADSLGLSVDDNLVMVKMFVKESL